jgi:hypothetical protein
LIKPYKKLSKLGHEIPSRMSFSLYKKRNVASKTVAILVDENK